MKIRELAGAEQDLEEALTYYSDLSSLCVEDLLQEIAAAKRRHCAISAGMASARRRNAMLRSVHYSYSIVYQLRKDEILIVAYAHFKRRPGY